MKKKFLSWLFIATIIITNLMDNLQLAYAASAENADAFNYTMVSLSKSEDFVINANGGNLSGNIASNKSIRIGNVNKNCNILENQSLEFPDFINASYEKYFDLLINENITKSLRDNQNLNINESIRAISDIEIRSQTINGNDVAIISESGSINIEANNISMSGFIYAPKGKIKITGDNVNLNGICIIADTIEIVASNVNINGSQKIIEWINQNINIDLNEYYLFGFGVYSDNVIKIYWNTNINGAIDIYDSIDNVSYSKVITVSDADIFEYAVTSQFDVKYIKLSANGLSSIPFVIKQVEGGYEVSLLDSDYDKIPDVLEEYYGTNSLLPDSDNDDLADYDEVVYTKTNPIVYDSVEEGIFDGEIDIDKDGVINKKEIEIASDPLSKDTDDDGLTDGDEINLYGTNPLLKDTDSDGLSDSSEFRFNTLPLNPDTDNNGILDGNELYEQGILEKCYGESLFTDNIARPSISVTAKGDASDNARCLEYVGHLKGDGHEFIGKCVEISGTDSVEGIISFCLDKDYKLPRYNICNYNTNGLLICVNIDETTIPLETYYDETTRTLSADFQNDGIYFVMDTVYWLESLGINVNDVASDINSASQPKYYERSMMSAYSAGIEYEEVIEASDLSDITELTIAGKKVSGQTDIVFIVDTTGSMGSYINNVKNNINSFVDKLEDANIKPYFALVEYKDITCDGNDSTKVRITPPYGSYWFSSAESFKNLIGTLSVSGGGDAPETTIDGLEFARRLNMRASSQKFFIVVTDAGYKIENNYNISSMDEIISLLVEGNINTSVVTRNTYQEEYKNLYSTTGGIHANISGNFKNELLSIADNIIEYTNDGNWIVLNGLTPQFVKLKEKLSCGSTVDTDDDGLSDVSELVSLKPVRKYNAADYMSKLLLNSLTPTITKDWDIYVYNYNSNPAKQDTDNDGLLDGKSMTIETDDPLNKKMVVAPKDNQPKIKNGDDKVWDYYKKVQQEGWTQIYYSGVSGLDVSVNKALADFIVDILLKNKGTLSSVGYGIRDYILLFKSMIEGDTVLGAYLLNFTYDTNKVAYHSQPDTWQREFGYNDFYDEVFDFGSYMDKGKYTFQYKGEEYVLWLWKGDYWNLQSGAEIGLYTYDRNVSGNEQYDAIDFEIPMELSLFNKYPNDNIDCLFNWKPCVHQWWITGFNPRFKDANPERMASIGKINLENKKELYNAMKESSDKGEKYVNISRKNIIFDDENYWIWVYFD